MLFPDYAWTKSFCSNLVFKACHDLTLAYVSRFSSLSFTFFPMYFPTLQSYTSLLI